MMLISLITSTIPVDGIWNDWIEGECSVTCGLGTKTSTRTCEEPTNGGQECSCSDLEDCTTKTEACLLSECPESSCQDEEVGCSEFRDLGYCKSEYEYMRENCPMTCGYCDEEGGSDDCTNLHEDCEIFKDQQYCTEGSELWVSWMAINCAESCGKCEEEEESEEEDGDCKDSSQHAADCPGWNDEGYCKKGSEYYEWMSENCMATCGTCDEDGGDEDTCKDNNDKCDKWKREGKCTAPPNKEYMLNNCKKSCNACEGEVTDEEIELSYKSVSQSSTSKKASFAVDKADRTKSQTKCTNVAKNPAWYSFEVKVNTGNEAKITKVKILNLHFDGKVTQSKIRLLNKLNGATVQVKTETGYRTCGTIRVNTKSAAKADQTYTIDCGGIIGSHVKIEQKSKSFKKKNCLDLYEVNVSG